MFGFIYCGIWVFEFKFLVGGFVIFYVGNLIFWWEFKGVVFVRYVC